MEVVESESVYHRTFAGANCDCTETTVEVPLGMQTLTLPGSMVGALAKAATFTEIAVLINGVQFKIELLSCT